MKNLIYLSAYILITATLVLPTATTANVVTSDNVIVDCQQSANKEILNCGYRQFDPQTEPEINIVSGTDQLSFTENTRYPDNTGTSAILLLVDTSDPAREAVILRNISQIKSLLEKREANQEFGLARFDKDITVLADIGSSNDQIINAANGLQAVGKTTELYRNLIKAIGLLKKYPADRKSVFLFSDGLAEDKAYFHRDVVKAANNAQININSIGFPRSVSQSVGLQTIRRISEETGGIYIESDTSFNLPDSFLANPFRSIENGGNISIDLLPVIKSDNPEDHIVINFDFGTRIQSINIPVSIPGAATHTTIIEKQIPVIQETPQEAAKQPVKIITVPSPVAPAESAYDTWLWYGVPIALLVLIIMTIATFLLMIKRQEIKSTFLQGSPDNVVKPYAYLVMQDETQKRYPITRETWRIGRGKDNELILDDNSVSRRHAEIHRDKGDIFTLIDLDSLNGIFVNSKKVRKYRLHEGDMVEIGDIYMRFTLLSSDSLVEESTVLQQTKAPVTH